MRQPDAGAEANAMDSGGMEETLVSQPLPQRTSRSLQVRLFLTCWLVYLAHFSPFVTREQYLAMSLAERGSVHVDDYVDLHPDLFVMPGRGSFVGANPGASFLAAIPYWLALPVLERVAPVRPRPPDETAQPVYREERLMRLRFYKLVRERGLDVRLGVGALLLSGFFMAPLAALGAVTLLRLFRRLKLSEATSLWMALLFALGTPLFLRAGTLSLNLLVTLLGLWSFALVWWPWRGQPERGSARLRGEPARYFAAGFLAAYAVATDFTGAVTAGVLGLFVLYQQFRARAFGPALRATLWFLAGAALPMAFLFWYQWYCFGNFWQPVQFHMPSQVFRGYPSARGFGWPLPEALWGLLFHPQYGLLVFAPVFALALYHPVLMWRKQNRVPANVALFAWACFAGIYLFSSCIHYTVRHQWQDGVRYIVPALPFLLLLVGDVMARMKRWTALLITIPSVLLAWCVAMVRESPFLSLCAVLRDGLQFPWLTTLSRAAEQYYPPLADPASPASRYFPLLAALGLAVGLFLIWRVGPPAFRHRRPAS